MSKRTVSGIMLTLLVMSMLTLAFNIQPVKASGTIYIRADGSIDPDTAPISTLDNITYTLTDNIYDSIVIERDNIILDGGGYTLQGTGSGTGIYLSGRINVTVQNTQIKNFEFGIWLSGSSNSISGNNITANNYYGIWLFYSSNYNSISGNNIANNYYGIELSDSSNNSISGNNIANNGYGIGLYYSSNYNSISGNNITANNYCGILLDSSSNNSISGNNITANNRYGIHLYSSSNNSISGNNITANNGYGIWLYSSSNYNSINGNNIANNGGGIVLYSSSNYNSISGNNIANNGGGIVLYSSSNYNSISGNNIANNGGGIYLYSSSNNRFYHNNIINNEYQVRVTLTPEYANVWDDGYPSGGNYWSDYTGVDADGDGIGDVPYVIDADNRDRYPLMNPWGTGTPVASFGWTPTIPEVGELVTFDASASMPIGGEIVGYEWDFGDGNYASGMVVTHTYSSAGNYTVTLNVTDSEGLWDIEQKQIEVRAPPPPLTYSLTITATVGGTTNPAPGTYSYTANSTVQVTAIADANYLFDYWELDSVNVGSANPYTVTMDKNHTLKAVFSPIPPPLSASINPLSASILVGQSVTFMSTVSGGYTPYSYQWYLNGNPVSGAIANTWTFTPTTSGIYYVHLKVTDIKGNTAQSDTARISVASVPVGGYSIPIQAPATATPLTPYLILTAILTIAFATIKRKTTKKTKKPP